MAHTFVLLINGSDQSGEKFSSFDEAVSFYEEWAEGMSAGYDLYSVMGDVDDSEIIEPDSVEYEIVEYDEDGNEVRRYSRDEFISCIDI